MKTHVGSALLLALGTTALAGTDWISFSNETDARLAAVPALGALDEQEKDYAWGDVDQDGDIDLVIARKVPFSSPEGRQNVLLINVDGVLTDLTELYIPGFLDATNDQDVQLADVNNDSWLDIVTAAACHGCNPGIVDDSRMYFNLGNDGGGTWQGFGTPKVLLDEGNHISVAAGDVNGDGYADLYFGSANDDFEDQLLINQGAGGPGVFVVDNDRLSPGMRQSAFATAVRIADMNGDPYPEIIKSDNGTVEVFRNSGVDGVGQFDLLNTVYVGAAYSVNTGDLNGDGLLDLVITDDGVDRRLLNDGDVFDGSQVVFAFPSETNGFGDNSVIADLDGDGWNDVIVTDVAVDVPGCSRVSDILRNNADPPLVTFSYDPGNIPESMLTGVHDVAVFDIDGDGHEDLVIGRCDTTEVWINQLCPEDLDGNGEIGIGDFLMVLGLWGSPGGDVTGDGNTDIDDFLAVIGHWGECP